MNIPLIPQDKANHFVYGAVIFLIAKVAAWLVLGPGWADPVALLVVILAGASKGGMDWMSNRKAVAAGLKPKHSVDPKDFVATVIGGLVCLVASMIR